MSGNGDGLLAGGVASAVKSVTTHFVQGTAPHTVAHAPVIRRATFAAAVSGHRTNSFNGAIRPGSRQLHDRFRIGLVVQPVANGQFDLVFTAGADHVLSLLLVHGHGLFAPHVFEIGRAHV